MTVTLWLPSTTLRCMPETPERYINATSCAAERFNKMFKKQTHQIHHTQTHYYTLHWEVYIYWNTGHFYCVTPSSTTSVALLLWLLLFVNYYLIIARNWKLSTKRSVFGTFTRCHTSWTIG